MNTPASVFTSNDPGALSVDQILAGVSKDDQEEWEYEYSSTETETFYLTLELSYPEFKERPTKSYHHSRGGYYKNWQDNDASTAKKSTKRTTEQSDRNTNTNTNTHSDDDDDDDDGDADVDGMNLAEHEDDGDDTPLDPALRALSKGKEPANDTATSSTPAVLNEGNQPEGGDDDSNVQGEDENTTTETEYIQVLELHSRNPVISYRGRLFEGKWAEVIGTEVILAQHDSVDSLPALRTLPGDIDLLAASSSRILTTEKMMKPHVPEQDTLAPIKEEWNIRIPSGKDKTGERAEQASFLENLIALKMKRGDEDQVTVYATDGAGKDWDDKKGLGFKPRRKKAAVGDEVADRNSNHGKQAETRPKGRPRVAKKLVGSPVGLGDGVAEPRSLSTPTPLQWEDLSRQAQTDDKDSDEDKG
ncbi:hypothetical protein EsDP_00005696 [Epichloe bromicola]|uniref:Transcription factor TFIIIC triple barrel domain-containing protein n=1 Tax=Epichloe bromicola TaxID=79588 RepID=A0ABQ0CVH2_9HYPO